VGNIPAVRSRRKWVAGQLANWRLYVVRMVSAGVSVLLAVILVPGLSFGSWSWGQGLEISAIFALINAFVKPVLQFLSLRFLFSSYGIVIVLVNSLLLVLLSWLLDDSIVASGIVPVLLGGALIGVLGAAIDAALGADTPVLDRDYREKAGLA
jgi:putative membrane protein